MTQEIQIQARDLVSAMIFRALVNRTPLTRIALMDGHKRIAVDKAKIKDFLSTGLSNFDFFISGFGPHLPAELLAEYERVSKLLEYESCAEAERVDLGA